MAFSLPFSYFHSAHLVFKAVKSVYDSHKIWIILLSIVVPVRPPYLFCGYLSEFIISHEVYFGNLANV